MGKRLRFGTDDGTLCTAVTDSTGAASCTAPVNLLPTVLDLGYVVDFDGDATSAPSTAFGVLVQ